MAKVKQLIDPKMLHQIINPTQPVAAPIHPIHRSISTLDRDMQNILQRSDLTDEEKIHQYNQILQRYLQYQDHLRAPNTPPSNEYNQKHGARSPLYYSKNHAAES